MTGSNKKLLGRLGWWLVTTFIFLAFSDFHDDLKGAINEYAILLFQILLLVGGVFVAIAAWEPMLVFIQTHISLQLQPKCIRQLFLRVVYAPTVNIEESKLKLGRSYWGGPKGPQCIVCNIHLSFEAKFRQGQSIVDFSNAYCWILHNSAQHILEFRENDPGRVWIFTGAEKKEIPITLIEFTDLTPASTDGFKCEVRNVFYSFVFNGSQTKPEKFPPIALARKAQLLQ